MTADVRAPGRPVTKGEVAACADPRCKLCSGRGIFARFERAPATEPMPGCAGCAKILAPCLDHQIVTARRERLCGCATRRFDRQHPEVIRDRDSGMHFWPKEEGLDA